MPAMRVLDNFYQNRIIMQNVRGLEPVEITMSNMDCTGCERRHRCKTLCDTMRKQVPSVIGRDGNLLGNRQFVAHQLPALHLERKALFVMLEHRHKLKRRQRQIFRMYYNKNMSTREIGRKLGINHRTASEYLKRARTSLARMAVSSSTDNSNIRRNRRPHEQ